MRLEDLTNEQLILLAILVSFVTSTATGIFTVSMLTEETPQAVTQTVSRVVERTIESVSGTSTPIFIPEIRQTTTVVKESDRIPEAIGAILPSTVILRTGTSTGPIIGLGVIVNASGLIVTDASVVKKGDEYVAVLGSSASYTVTTDFIGDADIAYLVGKAPAGTKAAILASVTPRLGETVAALGGSRDKVSVGTVSASVPFVPKETDGLVEVAFAVNSTLPGSPVVNLSGELIGIRTRLDEGGAVVASHVAHIKAYMKTFLTQ